MGPTVEHLLQTLSTGILVGCLYGLLCVGLAFIFGIMRVINFAQGDFMMLGMYIAVGVTLSFLGFLGASAPFVAALIAGIVMFLLGYLLHLLLISRTTGMRMSTELDSHQSQLILTLGVALFLQNGMLFLVGSAPLAQISSLSYSAWQIPLLYDDVSAVFINKARFLDALAAVLISVCLFALMRYTRMGKSLRAAAEDPEAALYMGIDVDKAHRIAFGLGAAIAGIAGGLIVLYYPAQPYVGLDFIIIMYAGVVLGGMGSVEGAFWGGMTIGLVQQLATLVIPLQLQNAAIFVVFVLILLVRPNGLFGRSVERA
ncbi:MAG: branched-chain amino acid ABC transporter permease [Hyphomicrobiales bacterium]|nr:branched-chain amino acid ABC transporter permease [Hyphomicrobiales bacterium]